MLESLLVDLNEQLIGTEDWLERISIEGEIEDLEVRLGRRLPHKPVDSPYLCEGCSS